MSQHKCYLVVGEVDYEPHDFSYAKIFLDKLSAEEYIQEIKNRGNFYINKENGYYGYPEIIELDLINK
jgi:hypothetical protein